MESIYKDEYFRNNCLDIAPYELFRNSVRLIESKGDGEEKQHLIKELCQFVGLIDSPSIVKDCEEELKQKGFIGKAVKIETLIEDDPIEEEVEY